MSQDVQQQIEQLVKDNKVVLFMKGTRMFPQCGFSARAVEMLKACGVKKFKDVNVLADPQIRQGIKDFSNWPTIPQCYIDGEFVGGSDILAEMFDNGELHGMLGAEKPKPRTEPPKLTLTEGAQAAFKDAMADAGGDVLRFEASSSFAYELFIGPKAAGDFVVPCGELKVHITPASADRIDGTTIDFVDGPDGQGFKIDNPNEPPSTKKLSPKQLKAWLDAGDDVHLFDVRPAAERSRAAIEGAVVYDDDARATLEDLPKDARIVFHCHHGVRSRNAAQEWVEKGYKNVHNLSGGIDAWSTQVDDSVPRY